MANRRPLDSSYQFSAKNKHVIFQTKAFILTLTLIACFISNEKCFGVSQRLNDNNQRWRYSTDYLTNSKDADNQVVGVEEFIASLPISSSSANLKSFTSSSANDNNFNPSDLSDSPSYYIASNPQEFSSNNLEQINSDQLYKQLIQLDSAHSHDNNDYYQPIQSSYSNNLEDSSNLNSKLIDLLQNEKKSPHSSSNEFKENPTFTDFSQQLFSILDDSNTNELGQKQAAEISEKNIYRLGEEDDKKKESSGKFTTLLEDEEDETTNSTTQSPQTTTTASYGKVVTAATDNETTTSTAQPISSRFKQLYNKLVGYLPFLNQIDILNGEQPKKVLNGTVKDDNKTTTTTPLKNKQQLSNKDNHANAKPSVSTLVEPSEGRTISVSFADDNQQDKRKHLKERKRNDDDDDDDDGHHLMEEQSASSPSIVKLDQEESFDDKQFVEASADGKPKISMLKQSSVVMPIKSNDELLVKTGEHPASLLGQYIYSPKRRYFDHLDTEKVAAVDEDNVHHSTNDERYTKVSHRAYSRRIHGNNVDDDDEEVNNSYAPFRPYYPGHRVGETISLVANKTNDMYFLVMVAAFCVMAMAVVLAAGLFAYRVQQNRKSATESDYPTYGVVGPNNMSGKCGGASSFVGGYFGSGAGGAGVGMNGGNVSGLSPAGSKLGSTKHLADLYSLSDSGINTGSSKASIRRVSTEQQANGHPQQAQQNKSNYLANQDAARMYHYQHQKQQMIISDRASAGRHTSASDLDSEDENDDGSYTVYECPGLASAHEMEIKNPLFNDDQTP